MIFNKGVNMDGKIHIIIKDNPSVSDGSNSRNYKTSNQ